MNNSVNVKVGGVQDVIRALQNYNTIILKPNIVDNRNVLTQEMMSERHTKYIIRWNYILEGATINVPEDCIIEFAGGTIDNGIIIGNNTRLIYSKPIDEICKAERQGTWIYDTTVADEEDITSVEGHLKFKDRPATEGMGKVILRKNKSFASQVTEPNTIYVIQYDFILGENITVPENCVLEFDGGSLSNGTIYINDSNFVIEAPLFVQCFSNIRFANGHPRILHTSWFGISSGEESDNMFEHLLNCLDYRTSSNETKNVLYIDNDIEISRAIEATVVMGDIVGIKNSFLPSDRNSLVRIFSKKDATENESLIKLHTQATNISGITFAWTPEHPNLGGSNFILELYPVVEANLDVNINNCYFYGSSHHKIHALKTTGRGVLVEGCVFIIGHDSFTFEVVNGVIQCITKYETPASNYIGSASEDSLRALRIINNRFHCGSEAIAIRLVQNPDDSEHPDVCFKGIQINGNYSDRGTKLIRSNANISDMAITNNVWLFQNGENNPSIFLFGKVNRNILVSDNLICNSSYNLENEQNAGYFDLEFVSFIANTSEKHIIQSINICSNIFFRFNNLKILSLANTGANYNTSPSYINVSNNVINDVKNAVCIYLSNAWDIIYDYVINSNVCNGTDKNLLPLSTTANNAYRNIKIKNNVTCNTDGYIYKRDNNKYNPHLSDTGNWKNVDTDWEEYDKTARDIKRSGTFSQKPSDSDIYIGFKYFCTDKQTMEGNTDGIVIYYKGSGIWVDALGRVVS